MLHLASADSPALSHFVSVLPLSMILQSHPLITFSIAAYLYLKPELSLTQKGTDMKKYFLPVLVLLLISLLPAAMYAQSPFPGGLPPTAKAMRLQTSYCIVNCEQVWPNSLVLLHDSKSRTIGMSVADAGGKTSVTYNCNYQPYSITSCSFTNSCLNVLVTETSLPVKLTSFTAEMAKNNSVLLTWKSSLEISSSSYVVQKSHDGKSFRDIAEVKAAGNSDEPVSYSYTDITYNAALNYFRLKQTDVDGHFEYSRTVYVSGKKDEPVIKLVSNTFNGEIKLLGIQPTALQNNNIKMYNASGQQVACSVTGRNSILIDASAPSGIYFLKIKDQTLKLYKQ
jgi:hypothetical protein